VFLQTFSHKIFLKKYVSICVNYILDHNEGERSISVYIQARELMCHLAEPRLDETITPHLCVCECVTVCGSV